MIPVSELYTEFDPQTPVLVKLSKNSLYVAEIGKGRKVIKTLSNSLC